MQRTTLPNPRLSREQADALAGTFVDHSAVQLLVEDEDSEVTRPDGSLLLRFRAGVLPRAICAQALPELRHAIRKSPPNANRATAAGGYEARWDNRPDAKSRVARRVQSTMIGFFDREGRRPVCRQTAWTGRNLPRFSQLLPFVSAVDRVFQETVPTRYAAQRAIADATSPDFVIPGTAFTTMTVNRNFRTAVHQDAGDLREGFGVLTALCSGSFRGGVFVLPEWGVGVRMKTGDVLLVDVHEWHGNTEIRGRPGRFERISVVFYYRDRMRDCGSAAEELARVQRRRPGDPIRGRS